MLRPLVGHLSVARRFAAQSAKKFVIQESRSHGRWVPWTIFGVSFGAGWMLTQHMTFTDMLAYWRYDSLPKDSQEVQKYEAQLRARLEHLSLVKQLKSAGYMEVFPDGSNKLIDETLQTPGGIAIPPQFYYNPLTKETVGIYHLGMKLTGYPFLIHGGIVATVMEDLMRESVKLVKNKTGEKTKDLTISYKLPTLANQFVVVRTTKIEEFGKNVKVNVEVLDQTGNRKLVQGNATFHT